MNVYKKIMLTALMPLALIFTSGARPEEAQEVFSNTISNALMVALDTNINSNKIIDNYDIDVDMPECESDDVNAQIKSFVDGTISEFKAFHSDGSLTIRYSAYKYSDYIVSYLFEISETVGNDTSAYKTGKIYDLLGGLELSRHQVFEKDTDYLTVIAQKASEQIAILEETNSEFSEIELTEISYDDFVFDDKDIYFIINTVQTPKTPDDIELVGIPLSELDDFFAIDDYLLDYFAKAEIAETQKAEFGELLINGEDYNEKSVTGAKPNEIIEEDEYGLDNIPIIIPEDQIGYSEHKQIAITFDDGPHGNFTPKLLDVLDEYDAKATFFLLGHRINAYSDIVERMVESGHSIGNHTYNHKQLTQIGVSEIISQIDTTSEEIEAITGEKLTLIRPPYGSTNKKVGEITAEREMAIILWSIDPQDWTGRSPDVIAEHVISRTVAGDIILLHDIYKSSVDAAEIIIRELTAKGFEFVTIDELIENNIGFTPGASYRTSQKKVIGFEAK